VTCPEAREFYNGLDPSRWGREKSEESRSTVREWLALVDDVNGPALEIGCGRGAMPDVVVGYIGLDLSLPALAAVEAASPRIAGDAESLPLRANTIEYVFSFAAIEHVPHPERVFEEIARVLRPGGVAVLAPAWHCRPWAAEGLDFRPYGELTFSQRVRKRLIPFRNALLWRAAFEAPRRVIRELQALRGRPMAFTYKRLQPNLQTYVGTDCDAFTSMDPHAAILFFATRGWEILSHHGRRERMLARAEAVVVRKPS
jgi:SAM-dependent methyltransferase